MSKFRFYDPQLAASIPSLPFSLYQPTTQEENVRRRYESLRRADRGTSPLRMELYDFLYGTGPTDEQLQYNPNDPQTSLLALRSMAQSGGAMDAVDAAARERNAVGSGYGSAAADTERINKPIRRTTGLEVDVDALQSISGRQGIGDQFSQALDAFSMGGGTFNPNRLPAFPPTSFMQSAPLDIVGERKARSNNSDIVEQDDTMNTIDTPTLIEETVVSAPRIQEAKPQSTVEQVQGTAQEDPTTKEGQSRIRSILSMLGDNPELLSALGILGQGVGGMMQSRAQDKANRRASQEQRVNNAIAAFLGGPAEVAQADTATSTGGNILGALGAALGGYGQARMTQRAMDAESDQMQLDRESAERIAQIRADANRDVANMNLRGRGGGDDGGGSGAEDPNAILNTYMEALRASPQNTKPYAEIIAQIPFVKRFYPKAVAAMSLSKTAGVALAVAVQGSRPTDKDAEALEAALPMPSDPLETQQAKLRNLRALINYGRNLQAQGNVLADGWGASIGANGAFSASDLDKFAGPPKQAGANGFSSLGSAQSVMAGN
jgi:hypothetical protein